MFTDSTNNQVVLFGGSGQGHLAQSDTWLLGSSGWQQLSPAASPPELAYMAATWDEARHCAVLVGGALANGFNFDTWLWDGQSWGLAATEPPPSSRYDMKLVFDESIGRTLLFGGVSSPAVLGDTWLWDGTAWSPANPAASPAGLHAHAMAYDPVRRRAVLYGGEDGTGRRLETYEWDGSTWLFRGAGPTARQDHAMAFDPVRGRTLLYGGQSDAGRLGDTWQWDGTNWIRLFPATTPGPLSQHVMVCDPLRRRVVLYGTAGTWEWDGTTWSQRLSSHSPAFRYLATAAFDLHRGRVVLFGGVGSGAQEYPDDTWEWDGTDWTERTVGQRPLGRARASMAYDSLRGRMVLFGGLRGGPLGDTWEYGPDYPARLAGFGTSCVGSAGTPQHLPAGGLPWLGDLYPLQTTNLPASAAAFLFLGFSSTSWNGLPLPMDLTGIGLTGCALRVEIPLVFLGANQGTAATWTLPLPTGADLLGFQFFTQSFHVDPPANPFGATLSNGLAHTIGGR